MAHGPTIAIAALPSLANASRTAITAAWEREDAGRSRCALNAVRIARNSLAVTGACLMTPRQVFDEVGGLATALPLNFNDVDYCLKVHASGRRIVYDPDLVLYHYESSSRDTEVREWEEELLVDRWARLANPDPFGNPNLRRGMPRLGAYFSWVRRTPPRLRLPSRL